MIPLAFGFQVIFGTSGEFLGEEFFCSLEGADQLLRFAGPEFGIVAGRGKQGFVTKLLGFCELILVVGSRFLDEVSGLFLFGDERFDLFE